MQTPFFLSGRFCGSALQRFERCVCYFWNASHPTSLSVYSGLFGGCPFLELPTHFFCRLRMSCWNVPIKVSACFSHKKPVFQFPFSMMKFLPTAPLQPSHIIFSGFSQPDNFPWSCARKEHVLKTRWNLPVVIANRDQPPYRFGAPLLCFFFWLMLLFHFPVIFSP